MIRSLPKVLAVLLAAVTALVLLAPTASATPPSIPSAATARAELADLEVASPGSMSGYSRAKFPHWRDQGGGCDTRDLVLRRDAMTTVGPCPIRVGVWYSPYEGGTQMAADRIDIDHIVPLAEAWRSGASRWNDTKRGNFANDLNGPQLIAVTDTVNQAKGDRPPNTWKPPLQSYWCTYARMWIRTKKNWDLTITSAEKTALTDMLKRC